MNRRLDLEGFAEEVAEASLALDCSDNFSTRFALNRACVAAGVPLISGAAIRGEGQLSVYDSRQADSPAITASIPSRAMKT